MIRLRSWIPIRWVISVVSRTQDLRVCGIELPSDPIGESTMRGTLNPEIITAAIEGFESQKARIDSQINELCAMLNGRQPTAAAAPQTTKRSTMSAAGRKRIAEAQRKRWAALKSTSEPAMTQPPKRKRRLSAAGRAAIVAALKKDRKSVV